MLLEITILLLVAIIGLLVFAKPDLEKMLGHAFSAPMDPAAAAAATALPRFHYLPGHAVHETHLQPSMPPSIPSYLPDAYATHRRCTDPPERLRACYSRSSVIATPIPRIGCYAPAPVAGENISRQNYETYLNSLRFRG